MKSNFAKTGLFIGAILLLFSCAQMSSPTGGPSDTKSPIVKEAIPENKSVNFTAKKVEIEFNEYIQFNDLNGQLVISPPFKKTPEFKIRGKKIVFDVEDTLKPNTTYTLNFGNAISDITEINKIEDFQYVFSTGTFIDSLFISGKIKDAYSFEDQKGFVVLLYKTDAIKSDSFASKQQPSYFAKTNDKGVFTIKNLAKGSYRMIALKDANANYLYDNPEEQIAFLSDAIQIEKSIKDTVLFSFKEEPKKIFVKSAAADGFGKIVVIVNKPFSDLKVKELLPTANFSVALEELSKTQDSLTIWIPNQSGDSLFLEVLTNNKIIDTAKIRLQKKPAATEKSNSKGKGNVFAFGAKTNIPTGTKDLFDLQKSIVITFNQPLKLAELEKIQLLKSGKKVNLSPKFIDNNKRHLQFDASLVADSSYKLYFPKGVFTDVFDFTNDSLVYSFTMQNPDNYGKIKLEITAPPNNYILQLYTKENKLVKETKFSGSFVYELNNVLPQSYKVKVIEDSNNNERWDTGNLYQNKQPEKIFIFDKSLDVRANWDLEEKWQLQ